MTCFYGLFRQNCIYQFNFNFNINQVILDIELKKFHKILFSLSIPVFVCKYFYDKNVQQISFKFKLYQFLVLIERRGDTSVFSDVVFETNIFSNSENKIYRVSNACSNVCTQLITDIIYFKYIHTHFKLLKHEIKLSLPKDCFIQQVVNSLCQFLLLF